MTEISTKTPESQTQLPHEALAVLDEAELRGIQFLADHPNLKVHIHFSDHIKAEDLGDHSLFEAPLARAHLYAFEGKGYSQLDQALVTQISQRQPGMLAMISRNPSSFDRRERRAIYNTGVTAIAVDAPSGHRVLTGKTPTKQLEHELVLALKKHQDALHPEVQEIAQTIADNESAREWVMLSQLGTKIAELSATDPEIASMLESGDLNIFMTRGKLHTTLFYKLRKLGLDPTRTFPEKRFFYPTLTSIVRKKMLQELNSAMTDAQAAA